MIGQSLSCLFVALTAGQLGGTQPNELLLAPEPSSSCGCHDDFNSRDVVRPAQSYRVTMMALAARDPLFRTAFLVAREDKPELSELCLRCHAPAGWLNGRSEGDLDVLISDDLEGVTCDICHRLEAATPPLVGSGQYTIAPQTSKRSRRGAEPFGGHMVLQTPYVGSAEACAICHSLFNPAEPAHRADAVELPFAYYEQRTYEEWLDSAFSGVGEPTCIDCHMKVTRGTAVRDGPEYSDLLVHSFVGGNRFALDAMAVLKRDLFSVGGFELEAARGWIEESLASAADLEITAPTAGRLNVESGEAISLGVKITNLTGHKLPTGYPEGRRVYLELSIAMDGQSPIILSGRWDQSTGDVVRDQQLRAYETEHGRVTNGVGRREHSLILMNQVLTDTRIPPRGFMPAPNRTDMTPEGRDYGPGPYRHWDEHTYEFEAPNVPAATTGTVTVRAMFQSTDGEVVRYLLGRTAGTKEANDLEMVYEALGRAVPQEMTRASIPITVRARTTSSVDAGAADSGLGAVTTTGGCGCAATNETASAWWGLLMLLLWPLARRRR